MVLVSDVFLQNASKRLLHSSSRSGLSAIRRTSLSRRNFKCQASVACGMRKNLCSSCFALQPWSASLNSGSVTLATLQNPCWHGFAPVGTTVSLSRRCRKAWMARFPASPSVPSRAVAQVRHSCGCISVEVEVAVRSRLDPSPLGMG